MQNLSTNNRGILRKLGLNTPVQVLPGSFKVACAQLKGDSRTFSFDIRNQSWVELTAAGVVSVTSQIVSDAAGIINAVD